MKQFGVLALLIAGLVLVGCGSNSGANPTNINGNWNATLMGDGNTTSFAFGTLLSVNGDGSVSVANFNFTASSPCFASGETESGSFTLGGNFNGQVNGSFGMTVQSGSPSGNALKHHRQLDLNRQHRLHWLRHLHYDEGLNDLKGGPVAAGPVRLFLYRTGAPCIH
jgi:hypothetical protein